MFTDASQACSFKQGVLDHGGQKARRTEGPRRPGGPRVENLEMPWRPENHDPARSVRPLHGSFPAPGDRCSHSLSRPQCQGRRPAVHWCGTTIGTSLRFCLQSNPAIKRGTKSPLITPCHKVICPEGNPSEEPRGAGGGVAGEERGTLPTTFQSKWLEHAARPSRPRRDRGQSQRWRGGVTREPSLELSRMERGIALSALWIHPSSAPTAMFLF